MKRIWLVLALPLVGMWLLSACSQPAPVAPAAPTTPAAPVAPAKPVTPVAPVLDAKALYVANCVVCHGANRQGVTGLGKPLTPESLAALSDDTIRDTTLKGKPNTAMAGFEGRLSVDEINALIQLIKYTAP